MKDRKKPEGTKARVQASKKRLAYIGTTIIVTVLVAIVAVSSFLIYSFLNYSPDQTNNPSYQLKAAIVDHLSLTVPNQTFLEAATTILKQAGYTVDYYPGEEVTIEFYRNLPTNGYGLILLRVHAVIDEQIDALSLFTSEPFNTAPEHVYEILGDRLTAVAYTTEDVGEGDMYFGISPFFVSLSMKGQFSNSTVIMMGCDGLTYNRMAEAFIEKGAKVYISWDGSVLSSHTDTATIHLLQHLITEKQAIKQAVTETMNEVGADPASKAILLVYPEEVWEDTIPSK